MLSPANTLKSDDDLPAEKLVYRPTEQYWVSTNNAVLQSFGSWLVSLENDFEAYAWGLEKLGMPLKTILEKDINQKNKVIAMREFVKKFPEYIPKYRATDWKIVHGFNLVEENGDHATATVLDQFEGAQIPVSLLGSVSSILQPERKRCFETHGTSVASLISHPELGVSPNILLTLID